MTAPISGRADRIVLVGIARSGTSWLGRALGHASGVRFYYEPDNVDADPQDRHSAGGLGFGPYPVIEPGQDETAFTPLWDMVFAGRLPRVAGGARRRAARALLHLPRGLRDPLIRRAAAAATRLPGGPECTVVKTIYSTFALEWLIGRYQPRVVAMQRHPLNVVSSWRQLEIPLFDLAVRPAIRQQFAEPHGIEPPGANASRLALIAWHVGLLTTVLGDALDRHPEWLFVTHEDLCADPVAQFTAVFERLGLNWTAAVEDFLRESNRPGEGLQPVRVTKEQPDRWKSRLTEAEVLEVEAVLQQFPRHGWLRQPISVTG